MAKVSIEVDAKHFAGEVAALGGNVKSVGKAIMRALTPALYQSHKRFLQDNLDKPTPYTLNSLYVVSSTSSDPELTVGIKDTQAGYLSYAYGGGHRDAVVTPVGDAKLNQYGNMPRGWTRSVAANGGWWMTGSSGVRGLFVSDGRGSIEAVAVVMDHDYAQIIDFEEEVAGIVDELLPDVYAKAFERVFSAS